MNNNTQSHMSQIDEYFKTTDYGNLKITPEQGLLVGKDIELVKGSDFHKNFYETPDKNLIKNINVRYYQIAMFDEFGKCAIRSFLFTFWFSCQNPKTYVISVPITVFVTKFRTYYTFHFF